MNKKYLTYKTAKLANSKGCTLVFSTDNNYWSGLGYRIAPYSWFRPEEIDDLIDALEKSTVQEWLLKEHKIFVSVKLEPDKVKYYANVQSISSKNQGEQLLDGFTLFDEQADAYEEGLEEALKLIKGENNF